VALEQVGRKLAAILAADIAGYSRLAGSDEERTLARLRALRSDLLDPTIAVHHGRVVKRTGDGILIEFRSIVDAVRCAVEVQSSMVQRNTGLPQDQRIEFRVGIHLGDVVVESDGDLMGDGVNIAARLEGIADPGSICLSEDAYRQVKGKIDLAVQDLGEQRLKNIAEPVRAYAVSCVRAQTSAREASNAQVPRLSIVVLPFANLSGDKGHDYFVDGVTESLTTDLSRIAGAFVIARNTAFTYQGKAVDVKQIGRELGVRYVLEGSIQRSGNRIRVNVQLVAAESGAHLWAERFDREVGDLFEMQDEIVTRLARALNVELVAAEARRAERLPDPDTVDLTFRGLAAYNRGRGSDNLIEAAQFFEQALALDPRNVEALAGLAMAKFMLVNTFLTWDRAGPLGAAEAAATRALALSPNHAGAHVALAWVYTYTNRAALAVAESEETIALDRNQALAYAAMGLAKVSLGRAEETEEHTIQALRISPRDTFAYLWCTTAGVAKLFLGQDNEAVIWLRRSIEANRTFPLAHFFLAAALAQQGKTEEAQAAARAGTALGPAFTVLRFRDNPLSDNPVFLAQRERVYEGMRKAGVPEE
jgi:TolB-like protein